jgi:hypothetical protein
LKLPKSSNTITRVICQNNHCVGKQHSCKYWYNYSQYPCVVTLSTFSIPWEDTRALCHPLGHQTQMAINVRGQ